MPARKQRDFLIVIPAYNEEQTIAEVVARAKKYADLCVVDDGSADATPEILNRIEDVHVIRHEINTHLPGALIDGMRYAVSRDYRYVITMDAGLSHNPDEIPRFIDHPPADLLIGVRCETAGKPLDRRLLSRLGNVVYNASLEFPGSALRWPYFKDLTSGFRRYSSRSLELLLARPIRSRSFDILLETASCIYRNRLTIAEIPITYTFSNSSLNFNVVRDCVSTSLHLMFAREPQSRS